MASNAVTAEWSRLPEPLPAASGMLVPLFRAATVYKLLEWTAPNGIECARMSSLKSQSRETVRGTDYPNCYGYVKERFPIAGVNASEQPVLRKKLSRREMVKFFEKTPPTTIALEACRGSHHWARLLRSLGHEVRLIAPQLAKPYVKRGKNDAADAEALCEAEPPDHALRAGEDRRSAGSLDAGWN